MAMLPFTSNLRAIDLGKNVSELNQNIVQIMTERLNELI